MDEVFDSLDAMTLEMDLAERNIEVEIRKWQKRPVKEFLEWVEKQ